MDRWKGKVAVVTGASAGIGQATVKSLAEHGLIVVGLARRKAQMEVLKIKLKFKPYPRTEIFFNLQENMKNFKGPGKFYARECDITKNEDVEKTLNWVKENLGSIDVLINNAGVIKHQTFQGQ